MTVHELIEKLKECPGEMQVVVDGYEGGYDTAHWRGVVKCMWGQRGESYNGEHDEWMCADSIDKATSVVYLSRRS